MKYLYIATAVVLAAAVLAFSGCVIADIPVNATPETKGITVTTNINAQGSVTASDSLTWQQSSDALNAPPLLGALSSAAQPTVRPTITPSPTYTPPQANLAAAGIVSPAIGALTAGSGAGEVQYTAGYTESTMAVQGVTSYTKTTAIDTGNKIADKNNIAATKIVTFIAANEQGRMTSSEDILVDGAGNTTSAADKILCPFGTSAGPVFPPFCNVVMSGSRVDLTLGSLSTSASERFVAATADVPVAQAYSISLKGVTSSEGSADAAGSASAFMTAHLQDGRVLPADSETPHVLYDAVKSEDVTFANSVSASGIIKAFSQAYTYQSGIRRL